MKVDLRARTNLNEGEIVNNTVNAILTPVSLVKTGLTGRTGKVVDEAIEQGIGVGLGKVIEDVEK